MSKIYNHGPFDDHARKKGSAELLVLAELDERSRHGYEIALEIERRSRVSHRANRQYLLLELGPIAASLGIFRLAGITLAAPPDRALSRTFV